MSETFSGGPDLFSGSCLIPFGCTGKFTSENGRVLEIANRFLETSDSIRRACSGASRHRNSLMRQNIDGFFKEVTIQYETILRASTHDLGEIRIELSEAGIRNAFYPWDFEMRYVRGDVWYIQRQSEMECVSRKSTLNTMPRYRRIFGRNYEFRPSYLNLPRLEMVLVNWFYNLYGRFFNTSECPGDETGLLSSLAWIVIKFACFNYIGSNPVGLPRFLQTIIALLQPRILDGVVYFYVIDPQVYEKYYSWEMCKEYDGYNATDVPAETMFFKNIKQLDAQFDSSFSEVDVLDVMKDDFGGYSCFEESHVSPFFGTINFGRRAFSQRGVAVGVPTRFSRLGFNRFPAPNGSVFFAVTHPTVVWKYFELEWFYARGDPRILIVDLDPLVKIFRHEVKRIIRKDRASLHITLIVAQSMIYSWFACNCTLVYNGIFSQLPGNVVKGFHVSLYNSKPPDTKFLPPLTRSILESISKSIGVNCVCLVSRNSDHILDLDSTRVPNVVSHLCKSYTEKGYDLQLYSQYDNPFSVDDILVTDGVLAARFTNREKWDVRFPYIFYSSRVGNLGFVSGLRKVYEGPLLWSKAPIEYCKSLILSAGNREEEKKSHFFDLVEEIDVEGRFDQDLILCNEKSV